jgi:hypothetical protein
MSNFTNTRPVGAALIRAERQPDGYDEADRRFSLPTQKHLLKLCNREGRIKCVCLFLGKFWSGHMYSAKLTSVTRCLVFCDLVTSVLDLNNVTALLLTARNTQIFRTTFKRQGFGRKMVATSTRLWLVAFISQLRSSFINWSWKRTSALVISKRMYKYFMTNFGILSYRTGVVTSVV